MVVVVAAVASSSSAAVAAAVSASADVGDVAEAAVVVNVVLVFVVVAVAAVALVATAVAIAMAAECVGRVPVSHHTAFAAIMSESLKWSSSLWKWRSEERHGWQASSAKPGCVASGGGVIQPRWLESKVSERAAEATRARLTARVLRYALLSSSVSMSQNKVTT